MFKTVWRNYLTSGLPEFALNEKDGLRLLLVNALTTVGVLSLLFFGLLNIVNHSYYPGIFELTCTAIGVSNIILLRRFPHLVNRAADVILILMLLVAAFLYIDGGIANTGVFWFFTYPPLAFFLKGKRNGWYWELAQILTIAAVALFEYTVGNLSGVVMVQIRQLIASLLSITFIVYLYEVINSEQTQSVAEKTNRLKTNNELLAAQMTERKRAEELLRKQNIELEKVKTATLNILEDLKNEKSEAESAQAKNKAIITNIGDGIITINEDMVITSINPVAERMLLLDSKKSLVKNTTLLYEYKMRMANRFPSKNGPPLAHSVEKKPPHDPTHTLKATIPHCQCQLSLHH